MNPFKYFENDNESYKALCKKSNKLYRENLELKRAVHMLKKEKYYWIPLITACSLIGYTAGGGFKKTMYYES